MGHVIVKPRAIIRRGMKRTIEDLGSHVSDPLVHNICEQRVNDWSDNDYAKVKAEIERLESSD